MISACKNAVSKAYRMIGDLDESGASRVEKHLSACSIRDACPYAQECSRTLALLRRDIGDTNASDIVYLFSRQAAQ